MESSKVLVIGAICIVGLTSILADVKKPVDVKDAELEALLKRSEELLQEVTLVAQQVDQAATEQVVSMKESIEQLIEEKKELQNEIKQVKDSIVSNIIDAAPFELQPILPDSEDRG